MSNSVAVPWAAWYGDALHTLGFPESWRVTVWPMRAAPDVGAAGIEAALDAPINSPPVAQLAARRRSAIVAVDDMARPTPTARLLLPLLARIEQAGVPAQDIRVLVASGAGRPLVRDDLLKKLGREVVERYEVHNHQPYENLEDLGLSSRGTPIQVNRAFLDADLRVAMGCISPSPELGFDGGAATVASGLASTDSIAWSERAPNLTGELGSAEGGERRADLEEIAERIGLDLVVDVALTSTRDIAGVFAGEPIAAHRAGSAVARQLAATALPDDLVDIVVVNAYPYDASFLQAERAQIVLQSAVRRGRRVLRPGGTTVITTASSEGRGAHALYAPGGRFYTPRDEPLPFDRMHSAGPVYYSPHLGPRETNGLPVRSDWHGLIAQLLAIHGHRASVAVFPTAPLQLIV